MTDLPRPDVSVTGNTSASQTEIDVVVSRESAFLSWGRSGYPWRGQECRRENPWRPQHGRIYPEGLKETAIMVGEIYPHARSTGTEPQAPSELSALQVRLENIAEVLSGSITHLRDSNDRAFGSENKGENARGPQPVPAGILGDCNMRIDVINALIEQLNVEIDRTCRIA